MKQFTPRVRSLIFVFIALVALTLLVASLGALQFSEGKPLPMNFEPPPIINQAPADSMSNWILVAVRIALIVAWATLPFFIIYLILNKDARKRFLRDLIAFLPILIALLLLASAAKQSNRPQGQEGSAPSAEQAPIGAAGTPYPLPEYTPPPPWITTVTTIAIGVVGALVIGGIVMAILRRNRANFEPLRRVEEEAQAALDSIQAGGDLRDAIIRCYLQMITALDQYRGIHRGHDITPHEFEMILKERGMPGGPVHDLTQLFEQVRYGGYRPGRSEEYVAVNSLSAIVSACQRTRGE